MLIPWKGRQGLAIDPQCGKVASFPVWTPQLAAIGGAAACTPRNARHRHGLQNPHPNGFWMGFGCLLVTLWMGTDGLFQPIQAHPTEFWMGYRWALDGLWMGVSSQWRSPEFRP